MSAAAAESVAVVIPAHNAARWIDDCLDAVAAQSFAPAEVLVVDDGSTDATADRVRAWQGAHTSHPVRLLQHATACGPSAARNSGWRASTAPWIAFCDADDVWHPQHLALLLAAAQTTRADVLTTDMVEFTAQPVFPILTDTPYARCIEMPARALFSGNFVLQSGALVTRAALEHVGGYDASRWLCEDYDLWARLAASARFATVPQQTVARRTHAGQASHRRLPEFEAARWAVRHALRPTAFHDAADRAAWQRLEAIIADEELAECWRMRDHALFTMALQEVARWPSADTVRRSWARRHLMYWPFRALQWVYDHLPDRVRQRRRRHPVTPTA